LTAAVAYLHSRSIDVLFGFGIDGDAGFDPDLMTLQFSQGGTGLPSKVRKCFNLCGCFNIVFRNTMTTKMLSRLTLRLSTRSFWLSTKSHLHLRV
jgi:hypothetical protein